MHNKRPKELAFIGSDSVRGCMFDPAVDRSTAPQGPYTSRQLVIGTVVLVIGLIIVFGIPIALGQALA